MFGSRTMWRGGGRRTGSVYVLALILLALFSSIAVAMFTSTTLNLKKSENAANAVTARLAAESGLSVILQALRGVSLPSDTDANSLIANLAVKLAEDLDGTGNLGGQTVAAAGGVLSVPSVTLDHGSFTCTFNMETDSQGRQRCRVKVTGARDGARRDVSMLLNLGIKRASIFNFGVASRGKISVTGSAVIDGMTTPAEASVLSASSEPVAIEAGGHGVIGGDLFITGANVDTVVLRGGGLSVGGESDPQEILEHHVHLGVEEPEFPEVDVAPFLAFAVNVIDADTDLGGSGSFDNVVIRRNTNPQFTGDTVVNGVMYIESPNIVIFAAGTTINGILVTDNPSAPNLTENRIEFRGHVMAPGVDALPDSPEFAQIKTLTGTVILAPGYDLTFRGTTNSINGTIAADQMAFRGDSDISGSLTGSVVGLKDLPISLSGNASIRINGENSKIIPVGFKHPMGLTPDPDTYREGKLD